MDEKILILFYIEKLKQKEIAKELGISTSTVSRAVRKDERYLLEKERRKHESKIRHNKSIQEHVERSRRIKQFKNKNEDLILKNMHNQASIELSEVKRLSDMAYRNWNISAYKYNQKRKGFEFEKQLGRTFDIPKFIKVNI